jgi:hypothetical protein
MLLQAGLPFRQLLLLSLVSGVLGLGGAALGVGLSLGPVPLTPWVFGVTAGVFLYVALVDMVRGGGCRETKGSGQVWRRESQPLGLHWEPPEGWQGGGWGRTTGSPAPEKQECGRAGTGAARGAGAGSRGLF